MAVSLGGHASDYNKFTKEMLDAKIKEKELFDRSDISDIVKNFWFKHETCNSSNKCKIKSRTGSNRETSNMWFNLCLW